MMKMTSNCFIDHSFKNVQLGFCGSFSLLENVCFMEPRGNVSDRPRCGLFCIWVTIKRVDASKSKMAATMSACKLAARRLKNRHSLVFKFLKSIVSSNDRGGQGLICSSRGPRWPPCDSASVGGSNVSLHSPGSSLCCLGQRNKKFLSSETPTASKTFRLTSFIVQF